jgi:hypothetical protein
MIAQNKQGTIHNSGHFRERIGAGAASFENSYGGEQVRDGSLRFAAKGDVTVEGVDETLAGSWRKHG